MRFNRAKLARASRLLEAAGLELAADPRRTCARQILWRQDVVALQYALKLAEQLVELDRLVELRQLVAPRLPGVDDGAEG